MLLNIPDLPLSSCLHHLSPAWLSSSPCLQSNASHLCSKAALGHLKHTYNPITLVWFWVFFKSLLSLTIQSINSKFLSMTKGSKSPLWFASYLYFQPHCSQWPITIFLTATEFEIPTIHYATSCLQGIFINSSFYLKWSSSSLYWPFKI